MDSTPAIGYFFCNLKHIPSVTITCLRWNHGTYVLAPSVLLSYLLRPPPTSLQFIYIKMKLLKITSKEKSSLMFCLKTRCLYILFYRKPQIPDYLYLCLFSYRKAINQPFKNAKQDFFFSSEKARNRASLLWLAIANMIGLLCKLLWGFDNLSGRNEGRAQSGTWNWVPLITCSALGKSLLLPGLYGESLGKATNTTKKKKNLLCYLIFISFSFLN